MARKSRKNLPDVPVTFTVTLTFDTWIYARLSLDSDRAEESIENQIGIAKYYINEHSDLKLCGVFSDTGYTGRDFDRPDFTRLMEAIRSGVVKCIVVKDLSRVGRTYIEVGEFLFDTLPSYGIRFISVNDNYDSFADDAARKKLLILFKNLMNHVYSRDLGKKIRSSYIARKQRGEPTGLPPFGYKRSADGKHLEFDGDAADIVREVFNLRQQGVSANAIAKQFTAQRIPSPQQRRYELGEITHPKYSTRIVWAVGVISNMLRNETYTGCLVQGKYNCDGKHKTLLPRDQWIRHENTHPAIIEPEQFAAVQILLDEAAEKYKKNGRLKLPENRYVGVIFCARCGKAVPRQDCGRPEQSRQYYSCPYCVDELKAELGLKRATHLTLSTLDSVVANTLQKHTDAVVGADKHLERLTKSGAISRKYKELSNEQARRKKELDSVARTLSAAYTHHLNGVLSEREFKIIHESTAQDKAIAESKLAAVEAEMRKHDPAKIKNNAWHSNFKALRKFDTPSKELVQTLIRRIEIVPITNELHVELNFKDGLSELQEIFRESGVDFVV